MLIETLAAVALMSAGGGQERAPAMGGGQERVAPRGDYRDSCSGEYVNRGRLYADCQTRRGDIRGTSIELNRCGNYEIRNNDGLLVCGLFRGDYEDSDGGRPGGPGGGWGGGNGGGWNGRASITVYENADYRGRSASFRDGIPNLGRSGLNDAISSMRVTGEWEACSDANYRGECRTFRDDVRNLGNHRFNDRISSLRPLRRGGR
ncbi:beta/gamma crystallin-related protein [Brevundimonas sp. GCM10030266]|uniref:beta/gamma crystallin-related protein n=1 Tax=Brevundimonas sp. GCM10030266 TaxID=3273386 RepID=UPI00361FD22B